jgi:hypothetical protein
MNPSRPLQVSVSSEPEFWRDVSNMFKKGAAPADRHFPRRPKVAGDEEAGQCEGAVDE